MPEPWDKLSAESDEAYARFLMYRNLGPGRSLRKAYKHYLTAYDGFTGGTKRLHVPGQWHADCVAHFWVERSNAWDVRNLYKYGARAAVLHVRTVVALAQRNARAVRELKPGDQGFTDLLASVRVVAEFLTPDVVHGIQERNQPAVPAAVPAGADERRRVE